MLKAKVQVGQYQKYKVTTNINHQPTVHPLDDDFD